MSKPFHMGWFLANGHGPQAWNRAWDSTGATDWTKPDFFVDMARSLERACFDFMMIEDSAMVPDTYGGSFEVYLKNARRAPKNDPASLVPVLAYVTQHIGFAPTLSTSFYNPYGLARLMTTLDHMSGGRAAWNIVTSSSTLSAANFGIDLPGHDERYAVAEEFIEVAEKLWNSWEPDAVVLDRETGIYADHTKVHRINHKGKYFSSLGPLNTQPSPQGKPVYLQAGGSPAGRQFAANHAEVVVCQSRGVEEMKAFRDDVHRRMATIGREPDSCKILFLVDPMIAEWDDEVEWLTKRRIQHRLEEAELHFAGYADVTGIDFAKIDLDAPLKEMDLSTEGHKATLEAMMVDGDTLREIASKNEFSCLDLFGTADQVAGQMEDIMQEIGGDGFLITSWIVHRRRIAEITDGLAPALQRRGLMRDGYDYSTLRENLMQF